MWQQHFRAYIHIGEASCGSLDTRWPKLPSFMTLRVRWLSDIEIYHMSALCTCSQATILNTSTFGRYFKHLLHMQTSPLQFEPSSLAHTLSILTVSGQSKISYGWWFQLLCPFVTSIITTYTVTIVTTHPGRYTLCTLLQFGDPEYLTPPVPTLLSQDLNLGW